ncbi:FAD-dependent oxidoreductase [Candidatus Parcubacteria bacterium]|nr:FAD-dependent oxidoreductase [Candidatus Parcubacteria bacterium]
MTYDLAIIGAGPAGTAAGVYAARKRLKTLLITKDFENQSAVSGNIQNWIGTISISGPELAKSFKAHLDAYKDDVLDLKEGYWVTSIKKEGDEFVIETEKSGAKEEFRAKTILLTVGSVRRKLEVPGAAEFDNKGLTYCATCDGPLFADQDVAVIGGGNAAFETALQLLAYCKSVTLLTRGETFRADPITVEKTHQNPKFKAITNAEIKEVKGQKFVNGLVYTDKKSSEMVTLPVTGIFVEIGLIPNTDFTKGMVELNSHGHIKVDPRTQRTSVDGIWAAGDASDGLYHQNNIAAGDAVKALEDIYMYLQLKK